MEFIMLKNVRVSFPHLFEKPMINGTEGKCGATLMLDPDVNFQAVSTVKEEIKKIIAEKFKNKKIPADKMCLRDGELSGRAEYEGFWTLSANSNAKPLVISNNGKYVIASEEDCSIYAGCYVNAKVRLWAQNNKYGKRVNAELVAIQFNSDGESLDGTHVSANQALQGFDAVGFDDDIDESALQNKQNKVKKNLDDCDPFDDDCDPFDDGDDESALQNKQNKQNKVKKNLDDYDPFDDDDDFLN